MSKAYIHAVTNGSGIVKCIGCYKPIIKNSDEQIIYFCSKECRKSYRHKKKEK